MLSALLMPSGIKDDDETHPIPHLGRIDVAVDLKNGAYYAIVVSEPLVDNLETRVRLVAKLRNYLNDFYSDAFRERNGSPLPGNLRIYVKLHPDSDLEIFNFLENCRPWLADNHVELCIGNIESAIN